MRGQNQPRPALTESVYEMIGDLSKRTGKPMAEILRDAVALEKWLDAEVGSNPKPEN